MPLRADERAHGERTMNNGFKACLACGGVLAGVGGLGYISLGNMGGSSEPAMVQAVSSESDAEMLQRGAYLMTVLDCHGCHSPRDERGQIIPGRELTGHPADAPLPEWDPSMLEKNALVTIAPTLTAFAGPFGVSVAPNLTPDKETGIGTMTADELIRSWRTGQHWRHDRPVMPPMPVPAYTGLTDSDIRALHAFLMTLPPVKNKAPESRPAQPN